MRRHSFAREAVRPLAPACLIAMLAAAGCAVGPNFERPAPPGVQSFLPESLPAQTDAAEIHGGEAQRFLDGMDVPRQWWTLFRCDALDELVRTALSRNPSVEQAQAALRVADENYRAQRGTLLPTLQANYSFTRQRNAVGTLAPTLTTGESLFNLHTAQVNVSYVLDVFGGNRRQVESMDAQADSQRFQLQATYLTLAANVVVTAIQQASLRAQIAATQDIIRSERESAEILRRQYDLGSIAMTDVMAQEAALATTEASLPGLQKQLEQARHDLAVLAGAFPSEPLQKFQLSDLTLPQQLPISVPANLVRRRPDVLAAEAQLHAATALVGVSVANMLPQINLTGFAGGAATEFGSLLASGNTFWSGGASLSQVLFAGGALLHRERAARAALDQAGAQYRAAVLTAFQNVADSLSALQLDAQTVAASFRAERAAADSLQATQKNIELGSLGYLALLSAEQAYQQAVLNLAQAQASRYSDTAALFQALGGGGPGDGGYTELVGPR